MHVLSAALLRLPDIAAFSGFTAAWLHGIDVPYQPVEATVPDDAGVSARSGMVLRRAALGDGDVVRVHGFRVTSVARTLADLSARLDVVEAVVIADAALHSRRVRLEQLELWATSHRRWRGIRKLRRVLRFVEPAAESPMESRLRMVLVLAGLPRPKAQVPIHDAAGGFVGRPDLYYETARLAIEYDGDVHRGSLAADDRRQNNFMQAGVRMLRFTASDVLGHPHAVVFHVRTMLAGASFAGERPRHSLRSASFAGERTEAKAG
jgi:very-short-patch-repair endonuclease